LYHKICKRIFRERKGGRDARGKSQTTTLAASTPPRDVEAASKQACGTEPLSQTEP
jgi:hypothetical protein